MAVNTTANILTVGGVISDGGSGFGFTKTGAGILTLSGSAANTYTGLTTVTAGTLNLGKTAGINAIAGNVLVNGGALVLLASNQIADTSAMTISSGSFNLNSFSETFWRAWP